jgi:hypothetical protein
MWSATLGRSADLRITSRTTKIWLLAKLLIMPNALYLKASTDFIPRYQKIDFLLLPTDFAHVLLTLQTL